MRLVLSEPKYLKDSIAIIADLVNEVRFKIDKDKIELVAMDPANVAMVIFKLLSSAFTEYNIGEESSISLSLDGLNQILKRAKPSDVLTMELNKEKNKLKIQLKGESTRTFNLSLLTLEDREQKVPELNFPVEIKMPTSVFNEAIEDMGIVAESVALIAEEDKFTIQSESKLNAAKAEMSTDEGTTIKIDRPDRYLSKYSLDYLKKIIKGSKLSGAVTIKFDKEYPLRTEYKVLNKLELVTILAPRVSND